MLPEFLVVIAAEAQQRAAWFALRSRVALVPRGTLLPCPALADRVGTAQRSRGRRNGRAMVSSAAARSAASSGRVVAEQVVRSMARCGCLAVGTPDSIGVDGEGVVNRSSVSSGVSGPKERTALDEDDLDGRRSRMSRISCQCAGVDCGGVRGKTTKSSATKAGAQRPQRLAFCPAAAACSPVELAWEAHPHLLPRCLTLRAGSRPQRRSNDEGGGDCRRRVIARVRSPGSWRAMCMPVAHRHPGSGHRDRAQGPTDTASADDMTAVGFFPAAHTAVDTCSWPFR